jgi:hypothetical protein
MIEYTPEILAIRTGTAWLAGADACHAGEPIDGPGIAPYTESETLAQAYRDGWTTRATRQPIAAATPCTDCHRPGATKTIHGIPGKLCSECYFEEIRIG